MLEGCVPWPEDFARRYRERGYWQGVTLFEMLERGAREHGSKTAIIDGERRVSYAELAQRAARLAAGFAAHGMRREQRVVFQLANGIELAETFFALARLGAIPVMALPAHRATEITHFATAAGASALCVPDRVRRFDYRPMAHEVQDRVRGLRLVIVAGEADAGQTALATLAADGGTDPGLAGPGPAASDVALMLLSGGTTGLPKLIPRTHDDYLYGARCSARAAGMDAQTVFLAVLPMAHNYTLAAPGLVGTLALGGTVAIAGGASDEEVFRAIERHRVTVVSAAVPLVAKWLGSPLIGRYDLGSLKVFMNGGAKLAPELRQRVEQRFGCTYQESFGTAEGLLNQTRLDDPEPIRMESSGCPVSEADELKVVGEDGREVPDGTIGELVCRGPYTIRGYYNAPAINREAFTADGFYRMGDIGRRIGGYLYLEGRKKDLINRGGEKISCEEIENHLLAHPDIESACVVAMPDPDFGEKACAFVIPRGTCRPTLAALVEFLETRSIARFKFPERLELVDAFPISPAGKILRRELREIVARRLASDAGAPAPAHRSAPMQE
ncbi:MAG TPA: AMP-binding protein [Burkholderiaceae bacterium]